MPLGTCVAGLPWSSLQWLPDHESQPTFLTTLLILGGGDYLLNLKAIRLHLTDSTVAYNPTYQPALTAAITTACGYVPAAVAIPHIPGRWYLYADPFMEPPRGTTAARKSSRRIRN